MLLLSVTGVLIASADLAGIRRIQYPPNVGLLRVPCTGRVNPFYIVKALQGGADGVLSFRALKGASVITSPGNFAARLKFAALKSFLSYIGMEGDKNHVYLGFLHPKATVLLR